MHRLYCLMYNPFNVFCALHVQLHNLFDAHAISYVYMNLGSAAIIIATFISVFQSAHTQTYITGIYMYVNMSL